MKPACDSIGAIQAAVLAKAHGTTTPSDCELALQHRAGRMIELVVGGVHGIVIGSDNFA